MTRDSFDDCLRKPGFHLLLSFHMPVVPGHSAFKYIFHAFFLFFANVTLKHRVFEQPDPPTDLGSLGTGAGRSS